MGLEGVSAASGAESDANEKTEREDPVAAHERKVKEKDEVRRARSERLGHEIVYDEDRDEVRKARAERLEASTGETAEKQEKRAEKEAKKAEKEAKKAEKEAKAASKDKTE